MKSATGRWVVGNDFFGREPELRVLETRVREGNHTLLSGQRRMGKTSLARELGRRLSDDGWVFLSVDVERADGPEDVVADIARAVHGHRSLLKRYASGLTRWVGAGVEHLEELGVDEFRVKIRAALNAETWRRHGERLFSECAEFGQPVLLVLDELPIFLRRLVDRDGGRKGVDSFLSWLRATTLAHGENSPVLLVSGSIGLQPLVSRLSLSDRINYLDPFRLGPWSREDSVSCFERLAADGGIECEDAVAAAVYDRLGIGIPHHVQSFFARLREFAGLNGRSRILLSDVDTVYRTGLLGPSGQNDLVHYRTRLKEGLDEVDYRLAMLILEEAVTNGGFTDAARRELHRRRSARESNFPERIQEVLEVLVHDGYLTFVENAYRFESLLLRDWFHAQFGGHHDPLVAGGEVE